MPLNENITSFAQYNSNCSLENTQFSQLLGILDVPSNSINNGGLSIRDSNSWVLKNNNLFLDNVYNFGNISGINSLNFSIHATAYAVLIGDVNFYKMSDIIRNEFVYTFFVKQGNNGGYSINWPFDSFVVGDVDKTAGNTTMIQLFKKGFDLYVVCNVIDVWQPLGTPVVDWTGNVLINMPNYSVTHVNNSAANVGEEVIGSSGGVFVINSDGKWNFNRTGGGGLADNAISKIEYTISNNTIDETHDLVVTTGSSVMTTQPIHRYTFHTDFSDDIGDLNFTNTGMVLENSYITGNGYNQYAQIDLQQHQDKWFTYSLWAERLYDFQYYQYLIGSANQSTSSNARYGWFLNFYNNKLSVISNTLSPIIQPLNTPIHIGVLVNSELKLITIYENGIKTYEGSLPTGTISAENRNIFQIGGFFNFSNAYCRGTKIHSLEIYEGQLASYEIQYLSTLENPF